MQRETRGSDLSWSGSLNLPAASREDAIVRDFGWYLTSRTFFLKAWSLA